MQPHHDQHRQRQCHTRHAQHRAALAQALQHRTGLWQTRCSAWGLASRGQTLLCPALQPGLHCRQALGQRDAGRRGGGERWGRRGGHSQGGGSGHLVVPDGCGLAFFAHAPDQQLQSVGLSVVTRGLQRGFHLFFAGGFDVPTQQLATKGRERFLGRGLSDHQQDGADVGAREILDQAGQQLQFLVRQLLGVVHQPDLGRGGLVLVAGGVTYRLAGQHLIEACDQGFGVGRKVDLHRQFGSAGAQPLQQDLHVMVEQRLADAGERQTQALLRQGVDAAVHTHAVGGAEKEAAQVGVGGVDADVHAGVVAAAAR